MSLVGFGSPQHFPLGGRDAGFTMAGLGNILIDAALEAIIMYGQIWNEDEAAHTIDTSAPSSLGYRTGAVTFADVGTTVKVGIAAVDTSVGLVPRAANVANLITFDVSATLAAGGMTATAWNEDIPDTGSKLINHLDRAVFCIQATARGGVDAINIQGPTVVNTTQGFPCVTAFTGGAYSNAAIHPNAIITYNDGKIGWFYGNQLTSALVTATYGTGSSPNEYGNLFTLPFPTAIYGIDWSGANLGAGAATILSLYSDPLGTPVLERSVTVTRGECGVASAGRWFPGLFSTPYIAAANQPLAMTFKPANAATISFGYAQLNDTNHQKVLPLSTECYMVTRTTSGAFAASNNGKDRASGGLLLSQLSNDVGSGGGGGSNLWLNG